MFLFLNNWSESVCILCVFTMFLFGELTNPMGIIFYCTILYQTDVLFVYLWLKFPSSAICL